MKITSLFFERDVGFYLTSRSILFWPTKIGQALYQRKSYFRRKNRVLHALSFMSLFSSLWKKGALWILESPGFGEISLFWWQHFGHVWVFTRGDKAASTGTWSCPAFWPWDSSLRSRWWIRLLTKKILIPRPSTVTIIVNQKVPKITPRVLGSGTKVWQGWRPWEKGHTSRQAFLRSFFFSCALHSSPSLCQSVMSLHEKDRKQASPGYEAFPLKTSLPKIKEWWWTG